MVRVGLWGTFGRGLGDALFPRIVRSELGRRLPGSTFRTWSPDGSAGEPLGEPTEARLDELAGAVDVLVIAPGDLSAGGPFFVEGLGAANEAFVPTAWLGLRLPEDPAPALDARIRQAATHRGSIGVRDDVTRERLRALGVESSVVPDPVVLVDRLFRADEPEERTARLRGSGALPEGDLLAVQGDGSLLPHVEHVAAQLARICEARSLTPVLVELDPDDAPFLAAIAERLPGARRLPAGTDDHDLCALLGWCAGFVGSSPAGGLVASVFDRPALVIGPDMNDLAGAFDRAWELGSTSERIAEMRARLDEHFDRLAALPSVAPEGIDADAAAVRSLVARLAALETGTAAREHELQDLMRKLTRQITESDVRFAGLWRKIHEGDTHYAWQFNRAEEAEELAGKLREEVAWLQSLVDERDRMLDERNRELERARSWYRPRYWFRGRRKGPAPPPEA